MKAVLSGLFVLWGIVCLSYAQPPTVFFNIRLTPQTRFEEDDVKTRWFTDTAERSIASLRFYFDSGYSTYVAQRFERIPGDLDTSLIDELYVEKVGGWRIGRFYAPFGSGWLLNESVVAVQSPTQSAIGNLPMRVAYLMNGKERQQGLLVRVGGETAGVSVGVGRHFGIYSSAFTAWRLPETNLDRRGYNILYGADYRLDLDKAKVLLEWIYSGDVSAPDTHWFGARTNFNMPGSPELGIVYQTVTEKWTWRLGLSQSLAPDIRAGIALRGQNQRIQTLAFTVDWRL
ncbi:MAG: hypothetical protein KIT45_08800 [Fimbriimonadia bacterium]|nr:hypothetical protein [Fimbriimonadia bacterium]